jgi:ADP-heptose:LPS heptosyltransferase
LDRVVEFPRKQFKGPLGLIRAWQWAKVKLPSRLEPEIVLDFQGLLRSAMLSRASGSKPVLGLSDSRECARFGHDYIIPVDPAAHAVDRYLSLARSLGVEVKSDDIVFPLAEGVLPPEWPQQQDLIVIHPWSRGQGKSLSASALQALCDALAPRPLVLVGITDEPTRPQGQHITDLSGRTSLAQLIACLRAAHWVVSVDSGPMHMAAAVNDRTLALHTWSDPRRVGPYNPRAWVWKAGRIAHRPDLTAKEAETFSDINVEEARRIGLWLQAQLQPAGYQAEIPLAETVLWDVPSRPARRPRGDS